MSTRDGAEVRRLEEQPLPSVEEALADAEKYVGDDIVDPTDIHPTDMEMVNEWTAEDFKVHYKEGGHAVWLKPSSAVVVVRTVPKSDYLSQASSERAQEDHLVWARKSLLREGARVVYSRVLVDEDDFVSGSVTIVDGEGALALFNSDPNSDRFERSEMYRWTISDDPYLSLDLWPAGQMPYVFLRLDANPGAETRPQTRDRHLSFLRKTRRTLSAGPIRSLDDDTVIGSLVFASHEDQESALEWAEADPYHKAGVFDTSKSLTARYCELDVTGEQTTTPYPLSDLADPVLSRLVDDGDVKLEERYVSRVELNPKTGRSVLYNISTYDPRLLTNVDLETAKSIEISAKALKERKLRLAALQEDDANAFDDDDDNLPPAGGDDDDDNQASPLADDDPSGSLDDSIPRLDDIDSYD